jgi:hypothetical protein
MMSRVAIKTLPIWNALRRSYLNPLFLLCPIAVCSLLPRTRVMKSMAVGEEPVNRFRGSGVGKAPVH